MLVAGSGAVGAAEAGRDIREFDGPVLVQTKPVMAYTNIILAPTHGASNAVLIPAASTVGPDDRSSRSCIHARRSPAGAPRWFFVQITQSPRRTLYHRSWHGSGEATILWAGGAILPARGQP